jgi:hypothetical protein
MCTLPHSVIIIPTCHIIVDKLLGHVLHKAIANIIHNQLATVTVNILHVTDRVKDFLMTYAVYDGKHQFTCKASCVLVVTII